MLPFDDSEAVGYCGVEHEPNLALAHRASNDDGVVLQVELAV
jgi:hypothetical protein